MVTHLTIGQGHSTRAALVSGTWYTPSATRTALVNIQLSATGIVGAEDADFSVSLRDTGDVVVTGYPLRVAAIRGAGALGSNEYHMVIHLIVPAGYDYNVTDNSTGATATTMDAIEDLL